MQHGIILWDPLMLWRSEGEPSNEGRPATHCFMIIIGAGVYIYFREKVRGQMIATDTPPNK